MTVKTEPGLQIDSCYMKKAAENAAFFARLEPIPDERGIAAR